jgi:DUF1680 family protein
MPNANGVASISVNGSTVRPKIEKGYAVITRAWKAGDRIDLVLPMKIQRIQASDKIAADHGRVALRYGPLIYNIEKVDQDINQALSPGAALSTEWKADLLDGVMVIKSAFANGSALVAIPNYARYNRMPAEVEPPLPPGANGRPAPRPPASIVWIKEQK